MSDRDGFGCLGSIISLVLLVVLWPYIIAAIGIYIAFLVLLEILAWVASNWIMVGTWLMVIFTLYLAIRFNLLNRIHARLSANKQRASFKPVSLPAQEGLSQQHPIENTAAFTPSTNLYCYWCTKKLGLQSWERAGKYYCHSCFEIACKDHSTILK